MLFGYESYVKVDAEKKGEKKWLIESADNMSPWH